MDLSIWQAFVINDVENTAEPEPLLFEKHVDYIAKHGNDKDDYVNNFL